METYLATFFSHFGAIRFHRQLQASGLEGTLMPVPRRVSSSCGTCVRFLAQPDRIPDCEDIEALFHLEPDGSFTAIRSEV